VERREAGARVQARPQVARQSEIAGPERVPRTIALGLRDRMHGEGARPLEPARVARAAVQLEERVAVARRAVAEARALGERAGGPDRLAGGDEQLVEIVAGQVAEADHEPRRAVADLQEQRGRTVALGGPVRHAVLADGGARDRLD